MTDWPFGALQMFGYDVIVADPPWEFELYSDKGEEKAAAAHYDTMSLSDLKRLPVGHLAADNCLLLLWTCGWAIATCQAQEVAKAWGFLPVTELVWRKITINGRVRMGPGYRARTMHEPILLCTTGNPVHIPFPSLFDGLARRHSKKPDEFYSKVKLHTAGARRADLFSAGIERPGFDHWGKDHRGEVCQSRLV